jgi:hypothetical protein
VRERGRVAAEANSTHTHTRCGDLAPALSCLSPGLFRPSSGPVSPCVRERPKLIKSEIYSLHDRPLLGQRGGTAKETQEGGKGSVAR